MKKSFLLLLLLALQMNVAFSEDADHVAAENVGSIYHDEQRTFHCERAKKLTEFLGEKSPLEIKELLEAEIAANTLLLKSKQLSFKEIILFRKNLSVLKSLSKYQDRKEGLKDFRESVCKGSQKVAGITALGLAWTANGIVTLAGFPFQAIGRFTLGLISGNAPSENPEIYYDIVGPTLYDSVTGNLLFSQRYIELAIAQPWIFPLIAAPVIDNEVMIICKRKNSLRDPEIKFCNSYIDFKKSFVKMTDPFKSAGANIHKAFSKKETLQDTAKYSQEEILKDLTEMTEENFCSQMVEIGKKYNRSRKDIKAKADAETVKIGLNPERYGLPEIADFNIDKEQILDSGSPKVLRNVVISLGSPKWKLEDANVKELAKNYRRTYKKFKRYARKGQKIFKNSNTIAECEVLKKKHKFIYKDFEALSSQIQEDKIGKTAFQSDNIRRQFRAQTSILNFARSLKLKWEFIDNGDIETINEILQSPDIGHVVLVIHGTQKGKVIDSNMNEIPRTFFKNISPSIISLNFFTCYSQKIDQYYGISSMLASADSFHPLRHLTFVEMDPTYSYSAGQVPFQSFAGYFQKLDYFLVNSSRGSLLYQSLTNDLRKPEEMNKCELQISNLGQKETTFSVTINNTYVGSVTSARKESRFEFDCRILKDEEENRLRMVNINLENSEPLMVEKTEINIIHPEYVKVIDADDLTLTKLEGNVLGILGDF